MAALSGMDWDDVRTIDARGRRCPVPVLRLQGLARGATPGTVLRLVCDDPMARIDVPHFARAAGLEVCETREQDGVLTFVVRVS